MDRLFRSITKKREEQQIFRDELVKLWAVAFREARVSLAPRARPVSFIPGTAKPKVRRSKAAPAKQR